MQLPMTDEKNALAQPSQSESGNIDIYADGSYDAAKEKGGWAFVALHNGQTLATQSGSFAAKTNNALELIAALKAAEWATTDAPALKVTIWSDSTHVVEGCNHWRPIWKNNGWKRYDPNPKARNRTIPDAALWKLLDAKLAENPLLTVAWCKGHQGVSGNELADELAGAACARG